MIVVISDTSVITALLTIGQEGVLSALYGSVIIPGAVERELRRAHADLPEFIHTRLISDEAAYRRRLQLVDAGEAEAITLAEELQADLLLMDETMGRRLAAESHIPVMGLMGVLIEAKRKGVVGVIAPLISRLEVEAGFRLGSTVRRLILERAGELGDQ